MSSLLDQLNERRKEVINFFNLREKRNITMIKQDPFSIKFIHNPSEKVQLVAIQREPSVIGDIKFPTAKAQIMAVEKNTGLITLIKSPCEEAQRIAVNQDPFALSLINPSEKVQIAAIEQDPYAIRYINDPTEDVQLIAVNKDPNSLELINDPTEKVKLAAVQKDGDSIRFIYSPSEVVQLAAVEKNPEAILYIENPSEEVQLAAVRQDGNYIQTISNPSDKVALTAVNQNAYLIAAIDDPSEVVQLAAVKQKPDALKYIKNPSEETLRVAKELNNAMNSKESLLNKIGRGKSENDLAVQVNRLCNQAGDNEQRIERILKAFNNVRNNLRSHGFGTELGDSYRLSSPKERLWPNKVSIKKRIEAIQVLQGNAPERILDEKFNDIREQYPHRSELMKEYICDSETGKTYNNIRMMSDKYSMKNNIYQTAKAFAVEIKDDLSSYNLSKYASDLLKSDNLAMGRVPTIKETLSLFSKEYILPEEINSAVFENEASGKYEITRPLLQYNVSKDNNFQFISAGTNPYSPNYKERFENLGLKKEFQEFEELCVKRDNWNDRYNYALQSSDIAEIHDLERELPKLDQKVEDSRKALYGKLNESVNCKLEGIKESLNDNGYENITKEIQSNQTSIVESLKVDNGSFQIKGVPVTEGRDKLYADITINRKDGNVTLSMNNLSIYNANSVNKITDANGLLTAMSSQGIKSPLDVHRVHLQDLIMGSAVNVQTASGMKAMHLAQSPAGLTLKFICGAFQQLDACASN